MIRVKASGSFSNTKRFFSNVFGRQTISDVLDRYGRIGVDALSSATPTDTGLTALSWRFEVHQSSGKHYLYFTNDNVVDGLPVAILIQYGHGTRNGGYVQGYDYINPAVQPIFDKIVNDAWKEVTA